MASNKSKSIGRRSAKRNASTTETDIVLVGTYRDKQLDWIRKNNIYHYPVTDKDELKPESCAKVRELWLYANAKGERHCFAAEFVGVQTKDEFLAANPTYEKKVGKPKHARYAVFKTKAHEYGTKLDGVTVVARVSDFKNGYGKTKTVAKAIEQFKRDGEFAPLAAYLPGDLATVPHQQLRVCEAAVQMEFLDFAANDPLVWSAFPRERDAIDQLEYSVVCINEFARKNGVPRDWACDFLCRYKGLEHLVRFYDVESTMPLDLIVEDLGKVCRMNGGRL